jgi:hypothetical protein
MANPNRPGLTGTGVDGLAPPDPPDLDQLRQIQLLAEAVLVSLVVTPNPFPPFGHATLRWEITMPTTVIPGVHIEVLLSDGDMDQLVDSVGSRAVAPYSDTTYFLYLRTPLASRQLGTLTLTMDLSACQPVDVAPVFLTSAAKREADKAFPAAGPVRLRGAGASLDIGINSFVVDIPVEASVPNWFNADIDVTLGFSIYSEKGSLGVSHNLARTTVSFGVLSGLLSGGCSAAVAKALEAQGDGFLSSIVGPVIAERIARVVQTNINENLKRLNDEGPPVPYKFYDLTLTEVGMTYRFCPTTPAQPSPTHPPFEGGNAPVIN